MKTIEEEILEECEEGYIEHFLYELQGANNEI